MAKRRQRTIRKTRDTGRYNKTILVQHQTLVSDGTFGTDPTWIDLKSKWARYRERSDSQYNRIAGKMEYFQFVDFYIQYDESIYTIPKKELRIIYPATGGNRAIFEIDGMTSTEGESFEIKFVCRGSDRGLN